MEYITFWRELITQLLKTKSGGFLDLRDADLGILWINEHPELLEADDRNSAVLDGRKNVRCYMAVKEEGGEAVIGLVARGGSYKSYLYSFIRPAGDNGYVNELISSEESPRCTHYYTVVKADCSTNQAVAIADWISDICSTQNYIKYGREQVGDVTMDNQSQQTEGDTSTLKAISAIVPESHAEAVRKVLEEGDLRPRKISHDNDSLIEFRKLAADGDMYGLTSLVLISDSITDDERKNWCAHGAGKGIGLFQLLFAEMTGQAGAFQSENIRRKKWLKRSALTERKALLSLANQYIDEGDFSLNDHLRAIDAWKRYHATFPEAAVNNEERRGPLVGHEVVMRNGHMLVRVDEAYHILDTGSHYSPTLDELEASYTGIREHIRQAIGQDIVGIFGNNRIMAGSGFLLDMRNGDSGMLWIAGDAGSVEGQRPPELEISIFNHFTDHHDREYPALENKISCKAVIDTGAQYCYLRHIIDADSRRKVVEDFTLLGRRFEIFETELETFNVCLPGMKRKCRFGNLPKHLSEPTFQALGADAIIGPDVLRGALLTWRKKDGLCLLQDRAYANLCELFIGTELNNWPSKVPSQFKSYHEGLGDYDDESFEKDIESLIPGLGEKLRGKGTWHAELDVSLLHSGGNTGHLTGRRRTMLILSCYFLVLIERVFMAHFNDQLSRYKSLSNTLSLYHEGSEFAPEKLLKNNVKEDPAAAAAFIQARAYFEDHVKAQVRRHFPALSPTEAWNKVVSQLPKEYPYIS